MAAPDLIIGLGHKKRVGKDAFAGMLDAALTAQNYWVCKLSFALAMKEAAVDLFRWAGLRSAYHYEAHPEKRQVVLPALGLTPRQIWIRFGNALRSIDEDIWVRPVGQTISNFQRFPGLTDSRPIAFIITDVRFPNEAEAIRSWGGLLMKVVRDSAPKSDDVADCALDDFDDWDEIIENNGGLADLENEASWLAGRLLSHVDRHDNTQIIPHIGDVEIEKE